MEQFSFNSFSFFSGVFAGLVIKWTDIIPILGGFVLGLSVKRLPEFINYDDLPNPIKRYLSVLNMFNNDEKPNKKRV